VKGGELKDAEKLLKGERQGIRHIVLRRRRDLDERGGCGSGKQALDRAAKRLDDDARTGSSSSGLPRSGAAAGRRRRDGPTMRFEPSLLDSTDSAQLPRIWAHALTMRGSTASSFRWYG